MIVLDTTVLVYAKGAEHPLRDPCRRLIEAIADVELRATTTVEAIQEFVHVRTSTSTGSASGVGGVPVYHPSRVVSRAPGSLVLDSMDTAAKIARSMRRSCRRTAGRPSQKPSPQPA